jgi:hypothetical protein
MGHNALSDRGQLVPFCLRYLFFIKASSNKLSEPLLRLLDWGFG